MLEAFGGVVRASSGPTDVGDGQEGADEACHPVIGICDVVEEVKFDALVEAPGGEI